MKRERKCFALFSGGLDSILAVKHMQKLGYEVLPIFFQTPFFKAESAKKAAEENGIELQIVDITDEHLEMMKNPRYGFGKNMNPCIDCHGLMFKKAGQMMKKYGVDFLISGEVLGQRPMSQRNDAMNSVAKLSEVKDLLIRPLCQKLIRDTIPINEGWVNKEEMLDIQGRGRYRQIALAKEYGVDKYQNSGGGCLLTDVGFSRRLNDLFTHNIYNPQDIELLRLGRHFRLDENTRFIIGRNNNDNELIDKNTGSNLVFQTKDIPGPLGLLLTTEEPDTKILKVAASLLLRYNNKAGETAVINYGINLCPNQFLEVEKMSPQRAETLMI